MSEIERTTESEACVCVIYFCPPPCYMLAILQEQWNDSREKDGKGESTPGFLLPQISNLHTWSHTHTHTYTDPVCRLLLCALVLLTDSVIDAGAAAVREQSAVSGSFEFFPLHYSCQSRAFFLHHHSLTNPLFFQ